MKKVLLLFSFLFFISCSRDENTTTENADTQFNAELISVGLQKNTAYKIQKRIFYNGNYQYSSYSPEIMVTFMDNNLIKEVQGTTVYISNYEVINSGSNYPDPNFKQAYLKITAFDNLSHNGVVVSPTPSCYFEKSDGELKLFKDQTNNYDVFKFLK